MCSTLQFIGGRSLAILLAIGLSWVENLKAAPDDGVSSGDLKIAVAAAGAGSKWDRYVEYIHLMADRIQTDFVLSPGERFELRQAAGKLGPGADLPQVEGWVMINRQGEVTSVLELDGPQALLEPVRRALAAAVADHHCFGVWPAAMALDLGEERQVALGFCYPGLKASPASGPIASLSVRLVGSAPGR